MLSIATVVAVSFVGCGDNGNAGRMADDMSGMASDAINSIETVADNMADGVVTDGDGIIGNEEDATSATTESQIANDNSEKNNSDNNANNSATVSGNNDNNNTETTEDTFM